MQAPTLGEVPKPAEELVTRSGKYPWVCHRKDYVVLDGPVADAGNEAFDCIGSKQVGHRAPSLYHRVADLLGRNVYPERQRHRERRLLSGTRGNLEVTLG